MPKFSSMAGGFVGYSAHLVKMPGLVASGGTMSNSGGYMYHLFSTSGTFTVSSIPAAGANATILMVAGGGGGGPWSTGQSGSGGAGGLLEIANVALTPQSYSITIGGGGAQFAQGSNTTAFGYTLVGGGYGNAQGTTGNGGNGGSGGGGGAYGTYSISSNQGGKGVYPSSTYLNQTRQGYDGCGGFSYNWGGAGAGGGANGVGGAVNGGQGGNGYFTANFASFGDPNSLGYFSSGGSSYWDNGYGNASVGRQPGGGGSVGSLAGAANTGGGGGGPIAAGNPTGGSGVVIIRYPM